jgi:hypothetical protein
MRKYFRKDIFNEYKFCLVDFSAWPIFTSFAASIANSHREPNRVD